MKAGIYLRISRDQTGEERGVTRQGEDCHALADRLGWEVVETYVDNDVSATSGKARPAYKRMLAAIKSGELEAVVVWHVDRLYRRATDLAELVEVVQAHNVRVATVQSGDVDLNSPTGLLVAEMLAAIAMYEVRHKTERWSRSFRQAREDGRVYRTGSRLFGYDRDMQVIPEEAEVARRMASDVANGASIQGVARWLEAEGIPATRGNPWRPAGVRLYLSNPKIAGFSTLKGEVVGEATWPAIVDRDTFETVRALLAARTRVRPPRVALLGGLVFCGRCGHRLITSAYGSSGSKKGARTRTYRCPDRPGMRGCGSVSGLAEPVEQIVEAYARKRLRDDRVVERAETLAGATGSGELLAEIASLEARIVELDAELAKPGVPVARLMRALDKANDRLAECQGMLAAATTDASSRHLSAAYAGGMPWPDDLASRRALVATALGDRRVWLDPARAGVWNPSGFDPHRVRITRERNENRPGRR